MEGKIENKKEAKAEKEKASEKETEKAVEERSEKLKSKVKNWLKSPSNAILLGILILALCLRLYYFFLTKDQALWWDGLCYGSLAKNFIYHQWDASLMILKEANIRPMLFPLIWSLFMRLNFPEIASKFILEIIPSFFTVLFVYLIAKKLYNKRIALISSFIFAVSWMHLFYSVRMLTHIPGLLASLASIYCFFKALDSEKINFKYFSSAVFLLFISALLRWTYGLAGVAFLLFLIITRKSKFVKQKSFWAGGVLGSIPIIIFFAVNLIKYNKLFPAVSVYASSAATRAAYAFYTLNFIPHILQTLLLICFIAGLVILVVQLVLGIGFISKIKKLNSHIFILMLLILNLGFLIFYIKAAEDRYLFECLISIIFIIAIAMDYICVYIEKYSKVLAVLFIIVVLAFGCYSQLKFGDTMIRDKKESYFQMKQAFLWAKDNTPENSIIFGSGIAPYAIYYSGRNSIDLYYEEGNSIIYPNSTSNESKDFDYVVFHAFSPQSDPFKNYLNSIQGNLSVAKQIFFDKQQQNPAVYVFEYNK